MSAESMPFEEDCRTGSGFTQNSEASAPGAFPETRWSLILRAGGLQGSRADTVWNEIGRIYWYPIYSYIRRWGKLPEEAEDITQLLFYEFLRKGSLEGADPVRGRFRVLVMEIQFPFPGCGRKKGIERQFISGIAFTPKNR